MVQGGRAQKAGDELRPLLETLGIVEPRDGDSTWADLDTLIGPVAWAWEGWLPEGMLTLIVGQFCEGKSQLVLTVMASSSWGTAGRPVAILQNWRSGGRNVRVQRVRRSAMIQLGRYVTRFAPETGIKRPFLADWQLAGIGYTINVRQ